jgi:hypothetical protein
MHFLNTTAQARDDRQTAEEGLGDIMNSDCDTIETRLMLNFRRTMQRCPGSFEIALTVS